MIDYDLASTDGMNSNGGNKQFGSANFHASRTRGPKDDLESVIYTLFYLSKIELGKKKVIGKDLEEGECMKQLNSTKKIERVQVSSCVRENLYWRQQQQIT